MAPPANIPLPPINPPTTKEIKETGFHSAIEMFALIELLNQIHAYCHLKE